MYKVIKYFTDLQDNNHPYEIGSTYPREGLKVTKARINELKGSKNKQGTPLITGNDDNVDVIKEDVKKEEKIEKEEKTTKSTSSKSKKKDS